MRPSLRQRFWKIRADRVIIAGGAFERPLLFGGNDVPGVMLADAVRHYLARHGVAAGRRPLFAVNNDDAYRAAFAAKRAGLDVVGIVDLRDTVGAAADEARALGIAVSGGCDIVRTHGRKALKSRDDPRPRDGRTAPDALRPARHVGRVEPGGAAVFAVGRGAPLRRGHRGLPSSTDRCRPSAAAAPRAAFRARRLHRRRRGGGAGALRSRPPAARRAAPCRFRRPARRHSSISRPTWTVDDLRLATREITVRSSMSNATPSGVWATDQAAPSGVNAHSPRSPRCGGSRPGRSARPNSGPLLSPPSPSGRSPPSQANGQRLLKGAGAALPAHDSASGSRAPDSRSWYWRDRRRRHYVRCVRPWRRPMSGAARGDRGPRAHGA